MVLSELSGDEQGIILGQLCNRLEPRLAVYFSSASSELRALLTPALQQQLRTDHEVAAALCLKMGMSSCNELREATEVHWKDNGLSPVDLATLGTLGSVLPALMRLSLRETTRFILSDGVQRLAERLCAGELPALRTLSIVSLHLGDAGASALAAALDRGALPRLKTLQLTDAAIGDAALVALAPALRRLTALEFLSLECNPLKDEGFAALVAPPPPPAGAPPPSTGVLTNLKTLYLYNTQITDAGCAALAAALDSGALPALKHLDLQEIPASIAAKRAVLQRVNPPPSPPPPGAGKVKRTWRTGAQVYFKRFGAPFGVCGVV